jgi:hypothetical protein
MSIFFRCNQLKPVFKGGIFCIPKNRSQPMDAHTVSSAPKYTFSFIDRLAAALHHGIVLDETRSG